MRANIIACLLAVGFFACLTVFDLRSKALSRVNLVQEIEPPAERGHADGYDGTDAYKAAVLLSIGAAIFSLIV